VDGSKVKNERQNGKKRLPETGCDDSQKELNAYIRGLCPNPKGELGGNPHQDRMDKRGKSDWGRTAANGQGTMKKNRHQLGRKEVKGFGLLRRTFKTMRDKKSQANQWKVSRR